MNEPETIRTILKNAKTIAVVGLSDKPGRASLSVARYMQQHGYRIVPVNPQAKSRTILGEPVFDTWTMPARRWARLTWWMSFATRCMCRRL